MAKKKVKYVEGSEGLKRADGSVLQAVEVYDPENEENKGSRNRESKEYEADSKAKDPIARTAAIEAQQKREAKFKNSELGKQKAVDRDALYRGHLYDFLTARMFGTRQTQLIPKYAYVRSEKDENGEPILDENGKPHYFSKFKTRIPHRNQYDGGAGDRMTSVDEFKSADGTHYNATSQEMFDPFGLHYKAETVMQDNVPEENILRPTITRHGRNYAVYKDRMGKEHEVFVPKGVEGVLLHDDGGAMVPYVRYWFPFTMSGKGKDLAYEDEQFVHHTDHVYAVMIELMSENKGLSYKKAREVAENYVRNKENEGYYDDEKVFDWKVLRERALQNEMDRLANKEADKRYPIKMDSKGRLTIPEGMDWAESRQIQLNRKAYIAGLKGDEDFKTDNAEADLEYNAGLSKSSKFIAAAEASFERAEEDQKKKIEEEAQLYRDAEVKFKDRLAYYEGQVLDEFWAEFRKNHPDMRMQTFKEQDGIMGFDLVFTPTEEEKKEFGTTGRMKFKDIIKLNQDLANQARLDYIKAFSPKWNTAQDIMDSIYEGNETWKQKGYDYAVSKGIIKSDPLIESLTSQYSNTKKDMSEEDREVFLEQIAVKKAEQFSKVPEKVQNELMNEMILNGDRVGTEMAWKKEQATLRAIKEGLISDPSQYWNLPQDQRGELETKINEFFNNMNKSQKEMVLGQYVARNIQKVRDQKAAEEQAGIDEAQRLRDRREREIMAKYDLAIYHDELEKARKNSDEYLAEHPSFKNNAILASRKISNMLLPLQERERRLKNSDKLASEEMSRQQAAIGSWPLMKILQIADRSLRLGTQPGREEIRGGMSPTLGATALDVEDAKYYQALINDVAQHYFGETQDVMDLWELDKHNEFNGKYTDNAANFIRALEEEVEEDIKTMGRPSYDSDLLRTMGTYLDTRRKNRESNSFGGRIDPTKDFSNEGNQFSANFDVSQLQRENAKAHVLNKADRARIESSPEYLEAKQAIDAYTKDYEDNANLNHEKVERMKIQPDGSATKVKVSPEKDLPPIANNDTVRQMAMDDKFFELMSNMPEKFNYQTFRQMMDGAARRLAGTGRGFEYDDKVAEQSKALWASISNPKERRQYKRVLWDSFYRMFGLGNPDVKDQFENLWNHMNFMAHGLKLEHDYATTGKVGHWNIYDHEVAARKERDEIEEKQDLTNLEFISPQNMVDLNEVYKKAANTAKNIKVSRKNELDLNDPGDKKLKFKDRTRPMNSSEIQDYAKNAMKKAFFEMFPNTAPENWDLLLKNFSRKLGNSYSALGIDTSSDNPDEDSIRRKEAIKAIPEAEEKPLYSQNSQNPLGKARTYVVSEAWKKAYADGLLDVEGLQSMTPITYKKMTPEQRIKMLDTIPNEDKIYLREAFTKKLDRDNQYNYLKDAEYRFLYQMSPEEQEDAINKIKVAHGETENPWNQDSDNWIYNHVLENPTLASGMKTSSREDFAPGPTGDLKAMLEWIKERKKKRYIAGHGKRAKEVYEGGPTVENQKKWVENNANQHPGVEYTSDTMSATNYLAPPLVGMDKGHIFNQIAKLHKDFPKAMFVEDGKGGFEIIHEDDPRHADLYERFNEPYYDGTKMVYPDKTNPKLILSRQEFESPETYFNQRNEDATKAYREAWDEAQRKAYEDEIDKYVAAAKVTPATEIEQPAPEASSEEIDADTVRDDQEAKEIMEQYNQTPKVETPDPVMKQPKKASATFRDAFDTKKQERYNRYQGVTSNMDDNDPLSFRNMLKKANDEQAARRGAPPMKVLGPNVCGGTMPNFGPSDRDATTPIEPEVRDDAVQGVTKKEMKI